MKKRTAWQLFILCVTAALLCAGICILNLDYLRSPPLRQRTAFVSALGAKYEKDGNIYIIDSGAFRLLCMTKDGKIKYSITVDKMKEYVKFYDSAVDEEGNLYVYAMEVEYEALLTKRDMIKKYDNEGNFIKNIFVKDYSAYSNTEERPHSAAQFGSLRCENGILTFSKVQKNSVTLYSYDTFRGTLEHSVFYPGGSDYAVAQFAVQDFNNFIYTMRRGDIYEVKNSAPPELRASCNFTLAERGVIPWHLNYDAEGGIVFFDMDSGSLYRISKDGKVSKPVPDNFFESLKNNGELPVLTNFGFYENNFAGVFGETVWVYDGEEFTKYLDAELPVQFRMRVFGVQAAFLIGGLALIAGILLLFICILDGYVSLFIKQTIIAVPITIISFIIFYRITFDIMENRLINEIFKELNQAVTISSALINGDAVNSLNSIKDYGNAHYREISGILKQIISNNNDDWSKLYYSAIYKGEHFESCVIMSNDEAGMFRPTGYMDTESPEYDIIKSGKSFAYIAETTDGTWVFAEIGLFTKSGAIAGILEIGLDMTSYQISNINLKNIVAIAGAICCVVILSMIIAIMSFIVGQISKVANVLFIIAKGDYNAQIKYKAKDEIGKVTKGLNKMARELNAQFSLIHNFSRASARFVPTQFMEHLGVTDITKMKLGDNVMRNLSILFFDIRAFSINSEMMSAEENFKFINKVLGIAGPIFRKFNGFVDKYLGDAALVLFDNAEDAVHAGIELYHSLILKENTRVDVGGDGINIGIGVHSGSVMMGLVGEDERLSGTVISKNVNLASRMESLTKQTGSGMLITRDTMEQIGKKRDVFNFRFIGMLQAAGVNEVIGVFDILDASPKETREKRISTKKIFESGVRKFHTKDYKTACERFQQVVKNDASDILAAQYLSQAENHLKNPGLPGVFIFDKK